MSMKRHRDDESGLPGQDSFLDIVANIVGILIILVMVVGVRALHAPAEAPELSIGARPTVDEMSDVMQRAVALQTDIQDLNFQTAAVQQSVAQRSYERDSMSALVAAIQQEIAERRADLDANAQVDFDLRVAQSNANAELDRLMKEQFAVESTQNVEKIESLPTPLSKTVNGREIHYQLRGGRVAWIPMDDLIEAFQNDARRQAQRLAQRRTLTETIGPLGGFRLRYELERVDIPAGGPGQYGRIASLVRMTQWRLMPEVDALGETMDQALAEGSKFHLALAGANPNQTTVTIWTYEDSFDDFRTLKKELFALGFATAGRPLPMDILIGGSPDGAKSSAQ